MDRIKLMASALAGIMFLMPGVEISAADTEGGGTQTDVFQPSEYEVEWLLPDGIENGGIFTVTFHEAVRLEARPLPHEKPRQGTSSFPSHTHHQL